VDVERGPDAQEHRGFEPADVGVHPALLLGRAQPDPDKIGPHGIDPGDDLVVLLRRNGPEGR
jgi:hypothetical protein